MSSNPIAERGAPPRLPTQAALYLDFDGTLVELAERPKQTRAPPELLSLLSRLALRQDGALAIVSGRCLAEIDTLLAPLRLPGAGVHGAELRLCADHEVVRRHEAEAAQAAALLHTRFDGDPRLLVEDKGAAVALHFRRAPERAADCLQAMRELAARYNLKLVAGKCVVELRPRGIDKGYAMHALAAGPPFRSRLPVFVGDDTTDEDGFAAAESCGGYGVKVGSGPSRARYRCRDVPSLHAWLRAGLGD